MDEGEGSAKEHTYMTHRHGQQCADGWRERGIGVGGGGQMGREREFAWSDGCMMQHAGDVL